MYVEIEDSDYEKWLSLPWKTSKKGNFYVDYKEFRITVFRDQQYEDIWKFCVVQNPESDVEEPAKAFSSIEYDDPDAAKTGALEWLVERDWCVWEYD
jgi:hypothetical protein